MKTTWRCTTGYVQASDATGRAVGILADLQGPKIRLGTFADGPVHWSAGKEVRITVEDCDGTRRSGLDHLQATGRPMRSPVIGCWSTTARSA